MNLRIKHGYFSLWKYFGVDNQRGRPEGENQWCRITIHVLHIENMKSEISL